MSRRRSPTDVNQLELFARGEPSPGSEGQSLSAAEPQLEARFERLREISTRLPAHAYFGTSSWSFPGWTGLVYPAGHTETSLAREGLRLYVRHPLFRTVGIDRGYYAPVPEQDWRRYASQLPAGFPCCAKAPELFTSPIHLRTTQGTRGGSNPDFLHSVHFVDKVAGPLLASFAEHLGPVLLEFSPLPAAHRLNPPLFAERLEAFLEALPPRLPLAVELRDPRLITEDYVRVLSKFRVAHVYNYWTAMPRPAAQAQRVPLDLAPFAVIRLLLRPGTRYEERKREFEPFDSIVDSDLDLRAEVVGLVRLAEALGRNIFVLVNNKAEGCAPLTIEALAAALIETEAPRGTRE